VVATAVRSGPVNRSWWLARGAIAALGIASVAIAGADVLNPGFNPLSEPISRYVNGTAGWLITVAILGIGAASAVLVGLLRRLTGLGVGGRIGRWALASWAGGVLVAGVFPADPPGRWSRPSTAELIHGCSAWLAFAAFPVAAVLLTLALSARIGPGRTLRAGSAAASVIATVVLAVLLVDVMDGPSLGFGRVPTLVGAVERVTIAANLAWLAVAAVAVAGPRELPGGADARA
jgi:hypothetical protein